MMSPPAAFRLLFSGLFCVLSASYGSAPVRSATVPRHVLTYLYYGAAHVNESLNPSYVAARSDFIEADASQPDIVNRFKAAGGRYAVMYTDPFYIPHCVPPLPPPVGGCKGPIGNAPLPEDAWLHGPSGERIHRADDYTHEYQEALNPASPAARAAFRRFTSDVAQRARVDFFFADDSGSPLAGPDGTSMSGAFYRFGEPGVEINDGGRYLSAMRLLLASAVRPLIVNGAEPQTDKPAYDGALIDSPNVVGENIEGCSSRRGTKSRSTAIAGARWPTASSPSPRDTAMPSA